MTEIIRQGSTGYPENLVGLDDMPKTLYVLGEIRKSDKYAVAVVGSRKMSPKGAANTYEYTRLLVGAGFTIVSGLAEGVDSVAHATALGAKDGRTIAVLGGGFDHIYPKENKGLAERIVGQGALVSEYQPQTKPSGPNFLERDRLISALSLAVLVVEGGSVILGVRSIRSGTLATAKSAANQGREVMAIPGSPATDFLIENGVVAINSPQEMLAHLQTIIDL